MRDRYDIRQMMNNGAALYRNERMVAMEHLHAPTPDSRETVVSRLMLETPYEINSRTSSPPVMPGYEREKKIQSPISSVTSCG